MNDFKNEDDFKNVQTNTEIDVIIPDPNLPELPSISKQQTTKKVRKMETIYKGSWKEFPKSMF